MVTLRFWFVAMGQVTVPLLDCRHVRRIFCGRSCSRSSRLIRFGTFEVDLPAGEIRKSGAKLKLTGQPFQRSHHLAGATRGSDNPGGIAETQLRP